VNAIEESAMESQVYHRRTLLGWLGVGAGTLWAWRGAGSTAAASELPIGKPLPDFAGATGWLNTPAPLTAAALKGNVVLVHIWTFACINCQRTLPYVVEWHRRYAVRGLRVVGVHTPEFAFEREIGNVTRALGQRDITYPNAIDNDFAIWKAYSNRYWPHLFLADRQGRLRYDHIGEGAYDTTERAIRTLLEA
jgi:thiol-disulfide isomerase/thioredoxin